MREASQGDMVKKLTLLLLLFAFFVVGCGSTGVLPPSTPPALPKYEAPPTPAPTPTYAPIPNLEVGATITLTSDGNKYLWLEYLGFFGGYDNWNCTSNHPEYPTDCEYADLEVHQRFFHWGDETVAFNGDGGGDLKLYGGWHKTTPVETPLMP